MVIRAKVKKTGKNSYQIGNKHVTLQVVIDSLFERWLD